MATSKNTKPSVDYSPGQFIRASARFSVELYQDVSYVLSDPGEFSHENGKPTYGRFCDRKDAVNEDFCNCTDTCNDGEEEQDGAMKEMPQTTT